MGGIYKKGDKLELKKKDLSNVTAFIYGENKNLFFKQLRSKVKFKNYKNLEDAVKNVFSIIKKKDLLNIRYYLALVQRRLIVLKTSKKEVYILID